MRRTLSLAVLAGVALGVPALCFGVAQAQTATSTSTYNTTCDKKPSDGDENAAKAYFTIGKKAYDEADYQKAIDNLKEAYKLDCTKPVLLNYVASAYIAKGDKAEAIAALEAFTKRDPKGADAEGVPRKIANLKQALASQTATATTATATTTATSTTTTTSTATGTATSTAPTATATDTTTPPERGHTALPWIVVGIGGAAMVTGIIFLAAGSAKVSDSFAKCPSVLGVGTCKDPKDVATSMQLNSDGRGLQNLGIVIGLVGVAAVGGGLLWHFLEPTGPSKSASIHPEFGPGYAGVAGTF